MFEKRKAARQRDEQQQRTHARLQRLVTEVTDEDGAISPEGFAQFLGFVGSNNIDLGEFPDIGRAARIGLAQGGYFMEESDCTLLLKSDETALLELPVTLLKEVADRRFQGGSQGVSIPLGRGFRYRIGSYRGRTVTIGSHWEAADSGQLTVTNRRVVYHGARKTLEFPFSKLATLNVYNDAIDLGVTSRESTSSFRTEVPDLFAAIIQGAVSHQDNGLQVLSVELDDDNRASLVVRDT